MKGNNLRRIVLVPLLLAVMSLMTTSPAVAGNFSQSCHSISVDGNQLSAICRTTDQREVETGINLDQFIGNIDGNLTWGESDFSLSSSKMYMDGSILFALCKKMNGDEKPSGLNLDAAISNIDGNLMYDN